MRLIALASLLVALGAPAAPSADVQRAKQHYETGKAHYAAGRYSDAVREFEAANAIKPHPIFLYDMAQAYRLAGDAGHALEMYRAYLAVDTAAKNRKSVELKIESLQKKLLASATPQAAVPAAAAPVKARVLAGLVAVLEFRSKLEGDEKKAVDAGYLADVVRSAALKSGPGIEVITRENLLVLLKAAGKSLEECEGECEVETGRKVGADLVVSGDLLRFGSSFKLALKLHDTRSGKLLSTAIANGKTIDELDTQSQAAAKELLAAR
jgi:tetratricopeptide (TPR) repeat protein